MLSNHLNKKIGRFILLALPVALSIVVLIITSAFAVAPYETISGALSDNTAWAVAKPATWNGAIVLDLDGNSTARATTPGTILKWMLDHGYAYGGITRSAEPGNANTDYNLTVPVAKLVEVRSFFIEKYGEPARTIAWGSSRGGFVARMCMELYPDIFNSAIVMAGGGAGEISALNSRLDSLFVLKTLVNPVSPMKIVGVANNAAGIAAENNALIDLVNMANSTPEGQARLALAAAVEQFAPWTVNGSSEPAANDYEAQYAQLVASLGFAINYVFSNPAVVRAPIEAYAGGVVSWNEGIDYAEMLEHSGRFDFVKAMYKKAGLDLRKDLKTLAKAPRIAADPRAVAKAEKVMSYTGAITGPIINVDDIGDPVDSQGMKLAYRDTLRKAGNGKLFRLVWVRRASHANQSDLEKITAFITLINRMDTGKWGDTSADAMNTLAQQVASAYTFSNPAPLFMENKHVSKLLRTWDVSNWDTYKPCKAKHICIPPEFFPPCHKFNHQECCH
jgi:pimeloyl-ACP methyl ester carboxylesterase